MGRIQIADRNGETMMKDSVLPEDADRLLEFGQSLVTALSEQPEKWGFDREAEAMLRASISAATYAVNTYMAVLVGARRLLVSPSLIKEAKVQCERNVGYLRRRITRSISRLCRHLDDKDLTHVASYVLLMAR
jgi:hypothetical protein